MNQKQRIEIANAAIEALEALKASPDAVKGPVGRAEYGVEEESWGYEWAGVTRLGVRFSNTECVEFYVLRLGRFSFAFNGGFGGTPRLSPLLQHVRLRKYEDFCTEFDKLIVAGSRLTAVALYKRYHDSTHGKALEKVDEALLAHKLCTERGRIEKELPKQQRILEEYRELHGSDISSQARVG